MLLSHWTSFTTFTWSRLDHKSKEIWTGEQMRVCELKIPSIVQSTVDIFPPPCLRWKWELLVEQLAYLSNQPWDARFRRH